MSEDKKNPVGRPPIHTDPNEVERLCNDYFEWIKGEQEEKEEIIIETNKATGEEKEIKKTILEWVRRPEPPTVTGLTLHLGFAEKGSLYDYAKKPEFFHSIKKALSQIEKHHEKQIAYGDKCTGNIFALKNFGWKDKIETESKVSGEVTIIRKVKK